MPYMVRLSLFLLQAEVRTLKQQLSNVQSTSKSTNRELQEKTHLVDFLQQELKLAQDQFQQSQEEVRQCAYNYVLIVNIVITRVTFESRLKLLISLLKLLLILTIVISILYSQPIIIMFKKDRALKQSP